MLDHTLSIVFFSILYFIFVTVVIYYFSNKANKASEELFKKYNRIDTDAHLHTFKRSVKLNPKALHDEHKGHRHAA